MMRGHATALVEPIEITAGEVSLIPFQPTWIPLAWEWLNQDPSANFDDYGPKTVEEFADDLLRRHQAGQILVGVLKGNSPVGIMGFQPVTERLGHFAGICFAKHAQGKGVGTIAVGLMLLALWKEGFEKVEAMFFADNERVAGLFRKLGAHDEGLLFEHALRNGQPVDVKLMGFVKGRV